MFLFRRVRTTSLPPLGSGFRHLWTASSLTNLGDGAVLAAGPLLVASLSSSATAVAAAAVVQLLPHLLSSLWAGALVDRLPRRAVLVTANLVRGSVLALLTTALAADTPALWMLYVALFAMGVCECLADTSSQALVAALGGLAGGLLADGFGLLVPFWVAAAALGGLAVAAWKPLLITERSSI